MKHENGVEYMIGCNQGVRIYSFMKEIKLYIRALCIVFYFLKSDNNKFTKEIEYVAWCLDCISGFH